MSGFCRSNRSRDGWRIAHFAKHNHVDILTESILEATIKIFGVNTDFALFDNGFLFDEQILNRVFNGNDMVGTGDVNIFNQRSKSCRLSLPHRSHDKKKALFPLHESPKCRRKIQLFKRLDASRNKPESDTCCSLLKETVSPKTGSFGITIGKLDFAFLEKTLHLLRPKYGREKAERIFRLKFLFFHQRQEASGNTNGRVASNRKMEVRGAFTYNRFNQLRKLFFIFFCRHIKVL